MKRVLIPFVMLFLLGAAIPAFADSISPVSVSAVLGLGDTLHVTKTVTVSAGAPTSAKADVFFLSDTTGSMGGTIAAVQASAAAILAGTIGIGDVAWGVGAYRDIGDVYQYQLNQAITTNAAAAQAGINMWSASGGGDTLESQLQALYLLSTQAATGWRPGSARILVWMGDYAGHDPGGTAAITEAQATTALQGAGVKALAVNVGDGQLDSLGQASRITAATGGALYNGVNNSNIVATISAAISTAFATYSNVSLDLSEAPAGVALASTPGSYVGAFDRSVARTFSFDLAFTGVATGAYDFHVYGLVDGGRVATESDHIEVGAVPEPTSIVFMSTLLLGLGGLLRRRLG